MRIDFGMELVYISDSCLMLFMFVNSPSETLFFYDSIIDLNDFTHRKDMIVHDFPMCNSYQVLHQMFMRFGIDIVPISVPF